jgi:hypothetical protein
LIDPAVVEAERRAAEARERALRVKHSFTVPPKHSSPQSAFLSPGRRLSYAKRPLGYSNDSHFDRKEAVRLNHFARMRLQRRDLVRIHQRL